MAIEFRCTGCNKLLRTQDDTAGKQAKCPQCGTLLQIPAAPNSGSGLPPMPPEPSLPTGGGGWADPASWQAPTGQQPFGPGTQGAGTWPSAAGEGSFYQGGANPYQSPSYGGYAAPERGLRNGPAWERLGPSPRSYVETLQECITDVPAFFATMRRDAGIGPPLGFALIGIVLATVATVAFQFLQIGVMNMIDRNAAAMPATDTAAAFVCMMIGIPIGSVFGMFFISAIYHLMLMMLDGANSSFEATFRAVAYTTGLTNLINLVPCCGPYISGIVALVFTIIGLAYIHDTSGWKASGAVLIPIVVCCCGAAAIFGIAVYVAAQQ